MSEPEPTSLPPAPKSDDHGARPATETAVDHSEPTAGARAEPESRAHYSTEGVFEEQPPGSLSERRGVVDAAQRATDAVRRTTDAERAGLYRNQVWGDFALGELLGAGAMGAVYRGQQRSLDRPVAIKVLAKHLSESEAFRARFLREARAIAQLSSAHVVQIYAANEHDGHHFFVMELVEGTDLAARLSEGWRPSISEAVALVTQAARGLVAAGRLGIIHRDIKPANMLLTHDGVLKLTDFGLVKMVGDAREATGTGIIVGTASYFSPEQARGERCDQRTDIYALGVVLYELLTGRLPFSGDDPASVIYQHVHEAPRRPSELTAAIHPQLETVVLTCLAKRPEDRFQNAGELVAELERLTATGQLIAATPSRRARPWWSVVLGGVGGFAILITALLLWPRRIVATPLFPTEANDSTAIASTETSSLPRSSSGPLSSGPLASAPVLSGAENEAPFDVLSGSEPSLAGAPPPPPAPSAETPVISGLPFIPFTSTPTAVEKPAAAKVNIAAPTKAAVVSPAPTPTPSRLVVPNEPVAELAKPTPPSVVSVDDLPPPITPPISPPSEPSVAVTPTEVTAPVVESPVTPDVVLAPAVVAAGADATPPAWAQRDRYGVYADLTLKGVVQRFRWLPPGTFAMGSPETERHRNRDENLHRVTIPTAFWISDSECTQQLWKTVMAAQPASFPGMQRPVEQVSWEETQRFLLTLGALVPGLHARLPSEAEWEYAARAGDPGSYPAPPASLAWSADNSERQTHDVKTLRPNPWGLFDCAGNVAEWCLDSYALYPLEDVIDAPRSAAQPALRGGSFRDGVEDCRSAKRDKARARFRADRIGFRIAATTLPEP